MKKVKVMSLVFVFAVFSFFLFANCSGKTQSQSVEQSEKNFDMYQQRIENIISSDACDTRIISDQALHRFVVYDVFAKQSISIMLDADDGIERFTIKFENKNPSEDKWLDSQLFVELVNAISGRKIDEDLIQSILTVSDKKERTIYVKDNWRLCYLLADTDCQEEIMYFHGLTEASTKPIC